MSMHLQRQIESLKRKILALGAKVEEMVQGAIDSIEARDPELARKVIQRDEEIDETEIDVEEECLHTLVLHQPVAFDIRYIVAVMKINNELERIADLAVNIAEQAVFLAETPRLARAPFDLSEMSQKVRQMVRAALDALVNVDPNLAEVDWNRVGHHSGKAVYRSLTEGRWLVTVTGDGSLGLVKAVAVFSRQIVLGGIEGNQFGPSVQ